MCPAAHSKTGQTCNIDPSIFHQTSVKILCKHFTLHTGVTDRWQKLLWCTKNRLSLSAIFNVLWAWPLAFQIVFLCYRCKQIDRPEFTVKSIQPDKVVSKCDLTLFENEIYSVWRLILNSCNMNLRIFTEGRI